MFRRLAVLPLLLVSLALTARPQDESTKSTSPKADHSREAFVVEQFSRKQIFESDGTSSREDTARVRIQAEAGVQRYGLLDFSYASGTGTFEIGYVRVRKPDGSVVETPAENVQDMAAQITREAPFYSDLHEKHVAVKGLSVGDVLEYRIVEHTSKPLAPGQFWTSYEFTDDEVILDEQLEISVPRDRAVKLKSPLVQPTINEAGAYRVYTWRHSNLQNADETNKKRENTEKLWQQARGSLPQPDVLMSSFATWDEVGRWYGGLQEERVKPGVEVTAKAVELTKNAANEDAKLHALYSYVSTQLHYIGVAFGIGRYQPHSAEAVLENQYGDCKDKHTLLASLLTASGIPAYPALISTTHEIDADVPSPGQFDHVITVVPRENGLVWLDTTAEVGPYQFLISPLRDKHALAIWKGRPAALVSTPVDLPYDSTQTFDMNAKLSDSGTLEGNTDFSARGDLEYVLRASFRAVPLSQWKDLGQRISLNLGFGGEVSEVNATSPEKTDEAFHFSYKYVRKEFGDWPNRRILAPEPVIALPAPSDEELLPLGPTWLGPSIDVRFRSQLEVPRGYHLEIPASIHVKRDFAQFDATYEFKNGKLISERHLKTLMREVPVNEREQYKQFAKTIQNDYGVFIPLTSTSGSAAASLDPSVTTSNAIRNLPDSENAEATRLESEAREAVGKKDAQGAISSLYRAVAADPKFARAWVMLGSLLLMQKQNDAGIDAFRKATAADPSQPAISKVLGYSLMAVDKVQDAIPVWQDFQKAYPEDADGPANLGSCFLKLKKYPESVAAFQAATKIHADRPNLWINLGSTSLLAGDRESASSAFVRAAEADADGDYLNDIAYQMGQADLNLPVALEYANKAVRRAEDDSDKLTLPGLKNDDLRNIFQLAANWDTLGWIHEHMSDTALAERYLQASWRLTQDGVVAGHLCHLYQRVHRNANAIKMCSLAVYRIPMSEQLTLDQYKTEIEAAQKNLDQLAAGTANSKAGGNAIDIAIAERTFKLPRFMAGTESAEFFVLLAPDSKSKSFKVEDVKWINGSEKMQSQGKQIRTIDFHVPMPDDVPTHVVRRGILGCYQYSGCSFVVLDPSTVHSVN